MIDIIKKELENGKIGQFEPENLLENPMGKVKCYTKHFF